jgi:hypothetical protein
MLSKGHDQVREDALFDADDGVFERLDEPQVRPTGTAVEITVEDPSCFLRGPNSFVERWCSILSVIAT